jgi:hypothetical protein
MIALQLILKRLLQLPQVDIGRQLMQHARMALGEV